MNKTELIVAAAEGSGMTQQDVWKVMDVLPGIIQKEVAAGNKVQLIGFGTFEKRFRQPGKEFKEAVNKPKKVVRKKRK